MIDDEKFTINETRPGEPDILRLPIDAKKDLGVETEDVIQNSRLKEIFAGSVITHNYNNDNISVYEKYVVSDREKNAKSFEIFINNESTLGSAGILKNNSVYSIAVNGEYVTSINNLEDTSFEYENNTIEIVFTDTNSTSIKQYAPESDGYFLDLNFNN